MKSQYSILLYSILRDWMNMGSKGHEISIKKLKEQLGATASSYDQFKFLEQKSWMLLLLKSMKFPTFLCRIKNGLLGTE